MESTPAHTLLLTLIFLLHFISSSSSSPILPKDALPTKSGYLPISSTTNSTLFYTFYEAQHPTSALPHTPLLIWLQGGPGCSSMIGNFYELGPYLLSSHNQTLQLNPNPGSWNRLFGLLFIDNPIGTGFSIASTPQEIPRNQHTMAKHLFNAIKSFLSLDPEFKSRKIYVTGESYAGKYVPAIGYYIVKWNEKMGVSSRVNLGGVAIGNGLTYPISQVATHALSAYYSGFINYYQKVQLEKLQVEAVRLAKLGNWSVATNARNKVLNSLQNMTGLATLYDFRRLIPYETSLVTKFLANAEVKKALGAKESIVYEECSDIVGAALHEDVMKSSKYMVEYLLKNSNVLLYQGQCDLRDGVVSTEAWMKKIKWEGIRNFLEVEKKVWKENGKLAGYLQKWGSLSHVVVLGAGHLVPTDQSLNSQSMIENWVLNKSVFANEDAISMSTDFHGAI